MISDLYKQKKPVLSLEVFPPKPDAPIETVYDTIDALKILKPDFISVTYGAGGSNQTRTVEIASRIKNYYGLDVLSHLTSVNSSIEDIDTVLKSLKTNNIKNIMALRGDPPRDALNYDFSKQEIKHASDLVSHIKSSRDFCIGGACYPEGHIESESLEKDIINLKLKVDCGVDFLISQLFFDNNIFFNFLDKVRKLGISCPVSAGIMPIYNSNMIKRITLMCGASIPRKLMRILNKYDGNADSLEKAGIEYAIKQIDELIKNKVDGIHLYTMNKAEQAISIIQNIH